MSQVFKLPAVMSMNRASVITDAIMKNKFDDGKTSLVEVMRHGIRGVQNINKDSERELGSREVSNIQETDTARLDANATGLIVEFSTRFLDLMNSVNACAPSGKAKADELIEVKEFRQSLFSFIERAKVSDGIKDVACRYARNIANGRWLWRNRVSAKSIFVKVTVDEHSFIFNSLQIPFLNFDNFSEDEKTLGSLIAKCLTGEEDYTIKISATVDFDIKGSIEVYPSQNYLGDKPDGFSRSLYKYGLPDQIDKTNNAMVGYAAIRDQKISNALRTIDTWYPDFITIKEPIPVEPNGASLKFMTFFRQNNEHSAFKLFAHLNDIDPSSSDGKFCIACMMRGGVFSRESDKEKGDKKSKKVSKKDLAAIEEEV